MSFCAEMASLNGARKYVKRPSQNHPANLTLPIFDIRHAYSILLYHIALVKELRKYDPPIVCSEWMDSILEAHLILF